MMNNSVKNFMMGDVTGLANLTEQGKALSHKAPGAAAGIAEAVSVGMFTQEVKRLIAAANNEAGRMNAQAAGSETGHVINTENDSANTIENASESKMSVIKLHDVNDLQSKVKQGNDIIAAALLKVSELLNLPEGAMLDPEQLLEFEDEDMVMFADVLWALDTVIKLFEKVSHDPAGLADFIEKSMIGGPNSGIISSAEDAEKIDGLMADLRSAKSHLDFGFYLLGMNDIIADQIAQRHGVDTVTGIAQAANPEDLGMSTNDLARLFGSLIKEELTSAMERVKQITSGHAEMTDLEKAAVRLGTVNSEILKAALYKTDPLNGAAFENINLKNINFNNVNFNNAEIAKFAGIGVDVNVGNDVDTKINTVIKDDVKVDDGMGINTKVKADAKPEINTVIKNDVKVDDGMGINTKVKAGVRPEINTAIKNDVKVDVNTKIDTAIKDDVKVDVKPEINTEVKTNAKAKVKAEAGVNTNNNVNAGNDVKAAVNTKIKDNLELPISAKESAKISDRIRESVEAANRSASQSVERLTAKFVNADNRIEIPVSVLESVNKKSAANDNAVKSPTVKIITPNGIVELPVSAAESAHKKVEKSIFNKPESAVKIDQPVKAESTVKINEPVKIESTIKIDEPVKTESTVKADNQPVKAESAVKTEQPVKAESTVKTEQSVKTEQPVKAESTVKAENTPSLNKSWADNQHVSANANAEKPLADNQRANTKKSSDKNHSASAAANTNTAASANSTSDHNLTIAGIENQPDFENIADDADSGHDLDGVSKVDSADSKSAQTLDRAEKAANAFSRVENEALIRQLTEKMHYAVRSGIHEIRMVLRPETLGEVRMSIRVEGDAVMARMLVESKQVKALVESNMQSLKDDLAKHNLNLSGFSVDVGTDGGRASHEVWQEMAEKSGQRKFKADAETFGGSENGNENDTHAVAAGSDTGRRFGSNTFEYFI